MSEEPLSDQQFVVDMSFKPIEAGSKLRAAETQLLLAYIGEILAEIEVEEQNIIEEERKAALEITARKPKKEVATCK